jgi:hypothetical protein
MIELFTTLTLTQVILFSFLILIAIKEAFALWEFFKKKIKGAVNEEAKTQVLIETIHDKLITLEAQVKEQKEILTLLTDSDRDDIRSWIVHQYHHFCENQKWIDDFSMDALEKRYAHYKREGGNSYITSLVEQLRKLPRHPK